jgi:hypothetical protein
MRGRPDPVGVAAEFLRKELAKGPVLVSELEAAARAAGLLGNGQRITHAKPFKRAKKMAAGWSSFIVTGPSFVSGASRA